MQNLTRTGPGRLLLLLILKAPLFFKSSYYCVTRNTSDFTLSPCKHALHASIQEVGRNVLHFFNGTFLFIADSFPSTSKTISKSCIVQPTFKSLKNNLKHLNLFLGVFLQKFKHFILKSYILCHIGIKDYS